MDEQVEGIKQIASSPPGTQISNNDGLPVRGVMVQKYRIAEVAIKAKDACARYTGHRTLS